MERRRTQQQRAESLTRTRNEIVGEMAASLGRVGRALEAWIERLHRLRAASEGLTSGEERSAVAATYGAARREASRHMWYLVVQREAIGLTDHTELERRYVIPGPLASELRAAVVGDGARRRVTDAGDPGPGRRTAIRRRGAAAALAARSR